MGRMGITSADVEKAALQLQAEGKTPTIDGIRAILNTGSKTTIGEHLKDWKAKQTEHQGLLPQPLVVLVTKLWETLQADASQRIDVIKHEHDESAKKLEQTLHQLNQTITEYKKDLHLKEEALIAEQQAKNAFLLELSNLKQTHEKSLLTQQGLLEKLNESKTENTRLHQLATQIQANLAHYQEATQKLQTEQALEFNKQQSLWQHETHALKQQIAQNDLSHRNLEQQLAQKEMMLNQIQEQLAHLGAQHAQQTDRLQEQENTLGGLKERCTQQEKRLKQQSELTDKNAQQAQAMEKQNAVLLDQVTRLQKEAIQSQEKIDILRQEKLMLAQEKSDLAGQLKHFNRKSAEGVVV